MQQQLFRSKLGQVVKSVIPQPLKTSLKNMFEDLRDKRLRQELFGELEPLIPPLRLMHDGPVDYDIFKENGQEYLDILIKIGGLQPNHKILDVGCGIGRKTIPLLTYFNSDGAYEGIDIVKSGIQWCQDKITSKYSNFRFNHINVYNRMYNPQGKIEASAYRFPFDDQSFDMVLLGSVFTHMLPEDVNNYMSEIQRVLKPDAYSIVTYFLLNQESLRLIEEGKSSLPFKAEIENCKVVNKKNPELAIAYSEKDIIDLYKKHDLNIEQLYYGSWCGREEFLTYQDLILGKNIINTHVVGRA